MTHPWYPPAAAMLAGACRAVGEQEVTGPAAHRVGKRVLVLGVPARAAMAALGRMQSHSSLEQLVYAQYEQMADTAQAHADELARRDVAEVEMRKLSLTDVLTGLHNRRGFFIHAEQVFKLAQRKQARSAVIFADVDGLKHVNDERGHETGDQLIRDAAAVFRESFRDADVIARLGGDEFVAYTLDDGQPDIILSRLHANLHAFNLLQERPFRVSISAGIVQCDPASEQNLLNYVELADRQMYLHKRRRLH
jgi:diguanylate cyclase (GGDEF)-like protein